MGPHSDTRAALYCYSLPADGRELTNEAGSESQ
jgi:hypothetical protein